MAASIWTSWGKAFLEAGAMANVDTDGGALPSYFYLVLIGIDFSGFSGDSDPAIENISSITQAINPAGYNSGNGNRRTRSAASTGFLVTRASNNGVIAFATNPVLTATTTVAAFGGFALCNADSHTTAKVLAIQRFNTRPLTMTASQTLTISGASGIIA